MNSNKLFQLKDKMIHNLPKKFSSFQLILFIFNAVVFSQECQNFSVSSITSPTSLNFDSVVKYICIFGHNDTTIWAIWSDIEISVQTFPEVSVNVVEGKSCDEVIKNYQNKSMWRGWGQRILGIFNNEEGNKTLSVSPYETNCFAISVKSPESVQSSEVIFRKLKLVYPMRMILGMILFYRADEVARSIVFYYTAGISLGMIMAVFLLLFVVSKFIPQRGVGYAFMFCGSSVVLFLFRLVQGRISKGNYADVKIFYAYFILAGVISFLYCYYRGPIESARGLDIMRWSLQSVSLFMVYYNIRCEKISLTFIIILITTKWISFSGIIHYILTRGWIPYRLQAYFRPPRFITMEEYEKEGIEETAKALKELQEYCASPNCNAWRTVSRLKSPKRFASFMSDRVDVIPEEREEYDKTSFEHACFLTSDEESQDELALEEL